MLPLAANPFAWIGTHPWLYPALEVVHLIGVALLLGNLALVELRLWGLGRAPRRTAAATGAAPSAVSTAPESVPGAAERLALGLVLVGFMLAAASGLAMFASQPVELVGNRAFLLKMTLLMIAGTNAAAFHARGGLRRQDALARAQTLGSLLLWVAILACGRAIAYA